MQAAAFSHLACLHMEGSSAENLAWRMSWEGGSETRLYYRGYLSLSGNVQDVPKQLRTVGARVLSRVSTVAVSTASRIQGIGTPLPSSQNGRAWPCTHKGGSQLYSHIKPCSLAGHDGGKFRGAGRGPALIKGEAN